MSENIFVGLDGGGTKTQLIVEDESGNLIAKGRSGPSNIRLSISGSWNSIFDALDKALKNTNISLKDPHYQFHVGMGLAGTASQTTTPGPIAKLQMNPVIRNKSNIPLM